jgi:integrase
MATIAKRQAEAGQRYDVRYRVNGKQHKRTFTHAKDAEKFKRKVEGDETAGLVIDPRGGEVLFGAYATKWLETRLVRGRPLTPMTRQGYEGLLRRNIYKTFKHTKLRAITPDKVREWYAEVAENASADAAAKSYRVLRAILNTATADDLIARNPCRIRGAGLEYADERPMLDAGEVLDLADAIEDRYRALVLLAGLGGLRTGEMLGLERRDVDLLRRQLHVRRQAQEVKQRGRVTVDPKSDAGKRSVALPKLVADAMETHISRYSAPGPDGVVFTGPGRGPLRRATLSTAWRQACDKLGLSGLRVHDLRHHAATTIARMPGVTTKELMAWIGHGSPRAALIYQHATEERAKVIAAYLDETMSGVERSSTAPVLEIGQSGA